MVFAAEPNFFVNGELLASLQGKKVRLIGTFTGPAPQGGLLIRTSDSMDVVVNTGKANVMVQSNIVEVEGMVTAPNQLQLAGPVSTVSDAFDFKNYDEMVKLLHGPMKHIIY